MEINLQHFSTKISQPEFLEQLMEQYADKLIGFINSYIFDIYSSEDIMMDCFVELIVRKPVFENQNCLKSYLYKTAKNKAINHLKTNKKLVPLDDNLLCDMQSFEEKIYFSQKQKILIDEIKKLKIKYKQVLYLSYFEDMSQCEIAEVLDLDERQVRNIKHRAKQKLNAILKNQNFIMED